MGLKSSRASGSRCVGRSEVVEVNEMRAGGKKR